MSTYYTKPGCWVAIQADGRRFVAVAGDKRRSEVGRLDLSELVGRVSQAELYRRAYRWAHRHGWVRRSWMPAWLSRWLDRRWAS